MKTHRTSGFSLIELLVSVAIVGILAAIAIPSYSAYSVRGSRAAAQTELLELAAIQEKIYLNSTSYASSVTAGYTGQASGGLGKTSGLTTDGKYQLCITDSGSITATTCSTLTNTQAFTITAKPVAGTSQAGNGCLTIQENGRHEWHENNDTCSSFSPSAWK